MSDQSKQQTGEELPNGGEAEGGTSTPDPSEGQQPASPTNVDVNEAENVNVGTSEPSTTEPGVQSPSDGGTSAEEGGSE